LNETTDNTLGFTQTGKTEQTVHTFSAKDTSYDGLRKDDNEELNKLREDIENYIQNLIEKLENSLLTKIETVGELGATGATGAPGETGATGAAGESGTSLDAGDFVNITNNLITTTYTAGNGIDIDVAGVISVVPTDFLDECS